MAGAALALFALLAAAVCCICCARALHAAQHRPYRVVDSAVLSEADGLLDDEL